MPETGRERDRAYTSQNTKVSDRGNAQPHSSDRVSGVGGNASGVGSSSGGDIDTDFVGLDGRGISQSGPDDREEGRDMVSAKSRPSDAFASPRPSDGAERGTGRKNKGGRATKRVDEGSMVNRSGGDITTSGDGEGPGAVTNRARNDDSFAGEVNMSEAGGIDNGPSDRG